MCGIFASIGVEVGRERIDIVAHRGPDGSGWEQHPSAAGPVALGHRRLAIIGGAEEGQQPMADPTGRFRLSFNGEIYNYRELRDELEAKGERFTTRTDSEVLLRTFALWGADCLPRLRGMFAFLVWDLREHRLFAARDRFGIKPLYCTTDGRRCAFGSEIKQLLGLPWSESRMNVARVHDYLASGITDHTAETLFAGVRQIRAGECAEVRTDAGGAAMSIRRWYPLEPAAITLTEDAAAAAFRDLLATSVGLHLRADAPLGSCLSGGLDSSAIVCLAAAEMPNAAALNTITACYAGESVDERAFAAAAAEQAGVTPHYIEPDPQVLFDDLPKIIWHQDEPFGSTSIFAQWSVFRHAAALGLKVMLDGQGADEQLAGYHFAFDHAQAGLIRAGELRQLLQSITERRAWHGTPAALQLARALLPLAPQGLVNRIRQTRPTFRWLSGPVLQAHGNPLGAMHAAGAALDMGRPTDLRQLCLTMVHSSNLQMLLHWEDRNSMAHSIEARVPFLDHPLVEFSLGMGNAHKIVGGDTKRVLRRAMAGMLPDAITERRDKIGFATPEQRWFRGVLRDRINEGIEETLELYPRLFDAQGARAACAAMLDGRMAPNPVLWRLVNLGAWGKVFSVSC